MGGVCVCEREREKERERKKEREKERERKREREREKERERETDGLTAGRTDKQHLSPHTLASYFMHYLDNSSTIVVN